VESLVVRSFVEERRGNWPSTATAADSIVSLPQ
jgi:hypothetical protein